MHVVISLGYSGRKKKLAGCGGPPESERNESAESPRGGEERTRRCPLLVFQLAGWLVVWLVGSAEGESESYALIDVRRKEASK